MTQTIKRRSSLFPFFLADGALIRTKAAGRIERSAPAETTVESQRHVASATITTRGQRFAIHQIGSMFGSD